MRAWLDPNAYWLKIRLWSRNNFKVQILKKMIQIKPQALIPTLIIPLFFLIACNTQSDDLSISETISIVPELGEYEFFIEGVVDDHSLHYK